MSHISGDRRWLEQHGGTWRVTVAVPRSLHHKLGTRLKQSLGTDSLSQANRMKLRVVHELRLRIQRELQKSGALPRSDVADAIEIRESWRKADSERVLADIHREIARRGEEILGREIRVEHDEETGQTRPVYDPGRSARADSFVAIATGKETPFSEPHERFLKLSRVKPRTKMDDVRAIKYLTRWCLENHVPATLEAITKKTAVRFGDALATLTGNLDPVTQNKYLNRLSRFWRHMLKRDEVESNPWIDVKVELKEKVHGEAERAFTDEEVRLLLIGGAPDKLMDLIKIGALSGARLDAIVVMKVKDTMDGAFTFKPQKQEMGSRDIPIHPALRELVARRSEGKGPEDEFFPEWPAPKKAGSVREKSFKASNAFTIYRRKCGVDETVPGKRRALVNFHSFRRWFITQAERAGFAENLIAAIVGHKRKGMTFGRYSEGPAMKQARRCVAAVKLPITDGGPVKAERAVIPRRRKPVQPSTE